uniref:Unannotated protein n=1 Tax=freshwater metagenome TaxID=449393 RepID=A0A6J7MJN4_9ZZZZ
MNDGVDTAVVTIPDTRFVVNGPCVSDGATTGSGSHTNDRRAELVDAPLSVEYTQFEPSVAASRQKYVRPGSRIRICCGDR